MNYLCRSVRKWNHSANCGNISTLKCDLTFDQQPDEFSKFFVRVKTMLNRTSSNWTTTLKTFQLYDTRLSSPEVNISTNQQNITINFSHRLELKREIKPLEFLLYLFENDPAGKFKCVGQKSTSTSPYTFHDVPPGNYCINVSASHQMAMRENNYNTTKCFFLTDSSERSSGGLVYIVTVVFFIAVTLSCLCVYKRYRYKYIIKDLRIPEALRVIPGTKRVLKFGLENLHQITQTKSNDLTSTEDCVSASEEDNTLLYHPRKSANVILNLSSVDEQKAVVHQPKPYEDAETLNPCLLNYKEAANMDVSEENISEIGNGYMHSGATVRSLCPTSNLLPFTESETPHISTVNIMLDRDCLSERQCEVSSLLSDNSHESVASDEEDNVPWDDFFTGDGYEPRPDPRT
nr:cytokine receptor family member B12 [Misgurnus anguillicaudatus]